MKPLHLLATVFLLFGAAFAETNPVPMIYQPVLPVTVKPGSKAFTLTVNGTGFAPTALVTWNGLTRATSYISSSQVQAEITAADIANPNGVGKRGESCPRRRQIEHCIFPYPNASSLYGCIPSSWFFRVGHKCGGRLQQRRFSRFSGCRSE